MRVLIISPGYPADMLEFTRGVAECGARVYGVGDSPAGSLPELVRSSLSGYLQVASLWDTQAVVAELRSWLAGKQFDRIELLPGPEGTRVSILKSRGGRPAVLHDLL